MIIARKRIDIAYTGVFFEKESFYTLVSERVSSSRLHQNVLHPHVTFQYMPQIVPEALFGEKAEFRVIGYGNDGQNEGLLIEWLSGAPQLKQLYDEIKIPHITLSYAEYGNPVNTRYLDFKPITPFDISGVFGGFSGSNNRVNIAAAII